jgi:hypothetical protein
VFPSVSSSSSSSQQSWDLHCWIIYVR